jgi:hypothetical protein
VSEMKGPTSWGSAWGNGQAEDTDTGLIRKLNFTTKDCQTPYVARHKTGEPMKVRVSSPLLLLAAA